MHVLFSDNRTTENWGCRATSLALGDLIISSGLQYESIYGASKRLSIPSLPLGDRRVRIYERINRHLDKVFKRVTGAGFLHDPDHWVARFLDFNLNDREESIRRFESLSEKNGTIKHIQTTINRADGIVVNGEGDMIFDQNRRTLRFMLLIMEYCQKIGKPVHFLNAMVSDSPTSSGVPDLEERCFDALRACQTIQFRDKTSLEIVKSRAPDISCGYVPDALFSWDKKVRQVADECLGSDGSLILPFGFDHLYSKFNFSRPYICVGGSSLIPKMNRKMLVSSFSRLCQALKVLEIDIYLVKTCKGDEFLSEVAAKTGLAMIPVEVPVMLGAAILSKARLFVSGRYHPSIMASLGGTPFIMFDSNSHKSISLQDLLDYKRKVVYPLADLDSQIETIVSHASVLIGNPGLRAEISSKVNVLSGEARGGVAKALQPTYSSV